MKKVILLTIALTGSLSSMGQIIALNSTANINPSKRFEKLNKEQASSFSNRKFKNDKIDLSIMTNPDHTYLVDSILVTLSYENKQMPAGYLLQTKKEMDDLFKKISTYTSDIKTVTNNKLLIISYTLYHVGYYGFFCYNTDN